MNCHGAAVTEHAIEKSDIIGFAALNFRFCFKHKEYFYMYSNILQYPENK